MEDDKVSRENEKGPYTKSKKGEFQKRAEKIRDGAVKWAENQTRHGKESRVETREMEGQERTKTEDGT